MSSRCDQVLVGDLFNKVEKDYSHDRRTAASRIFYSLDEGSAYNSYLKSVGRKSGEDLDIGARFPIKGIPIGIDIGGSGYRAYTETEFSQVFNKWKREYSEENNTTDDLSVKDYYATYVRDPSSISAWVECTKQGGASEVISYGFRDASGFVLIKVDWEPSIESAEDVALLTISPPQGVEISVPYKKNMIISQGEGITFTVRTSLETGFSIPVNVRLIDRDKFPRNPSASKLDSLPAKGNYTSIVVIPERLPLVPTLDVTVNLRGLGDQKYLDNEFAGTRDVTLPLDGLRIDLNPKFPGLGLRYFAHVSAFGDTKSVSDGNFVGKLSVDGQPRWMEGFSVELVGALAGEYDVKYTGFLGKGGPQVPDGGEGETSICSNGQFCGTRGEYRPMTTVRIWIDKKLP
ncbi:hypothetical protein [Synechococcus sp. BA-132 BA5]|uniref:hypothetical protein n=1 Tax=Synechococcus sp. BA-132 BA5 TaxID=3110252 RepID=UPI002B2023AD|nr:hypothetical protein [Synechococcus sp. BA-132 BA5]MEA5416607.1 hypothetical protein [Synechococcus sp. BA-132 BA5]